MQHAKKINSCGPDGHVFRKGAALPCECGLFPDLASSITMPVPSEVTPDPAPSTPATEPVEPKVTRTREEILNEIIAILAPFDKGPKQLNAGQLRRVIKAIGEARQKNAFITQLLDDYQESLLEKNNEQLPT